MLIYYNWGMRQNNKPHNDIYIEIANYLRREGISLSSIEPSRGYFGAPLLRGSIPYRRVKELAKAAGFEIQWVKIEN